MEEIYRFKRLGEGGGGNELSTYGLHWNHYTQTTELQKLWYSISSISWNCLKIK